jgi:hypothetical protein
MLEEVRRERRRITCEDGMVDLIVACPKLQRTGQAIMSTGMETKTIDVML